MRVLQINTVCGYGSTGRTTLELAKALIDQGEECYIAYGQGTTSYTNSYKIGTRIENLLHNLCSRISGKQGYFSKNSTKKLIKYIEFLNPDIIHLRNLHGNYINLKILFEYLSKINKPIVWTLHDCWAFTGKCTHYSEIKCRRWENICENCPQVKKYPPSLFLDKSKQMYTDKKKWFTSINNMTIITVSKWLADEAAKSFLSKYPIVQIYNWIDQSIFRLSDTNIKSKYGIDKKKFIILAVSAQWRKRDSKLEDIIHLSKLITEEMQIVIVGKIQEPKSLPGKIVQIPYIYNTYELAQIYSVADVHIHLSVEDTFGKVIAESLSCGTPVIVYKSTACPEILGKGCGFSVEPKDIESVRRRIESIMLEGKQKYSENCVNFVRENFNINQNINKIIHLYKSMAG